jgi:hypothetical protein
MKKLLVLFCCVTGILVTAVAPIHAIVYMPPTEVSCQGDACDGNPIRNYVYDLKNTAANGNLSSFSVGVLDNPSNITDILSPAGWTATITSTDFTLKTDGVFTNHGVWAPGPWSDVPYEITWTTSDENGIPPSGWTNLTFGFNDPNPPVDVTWSDNLNSCRTWSVVAGGEGTYTDGPVHTPAPEPSTIVLLIVGAIGLLAYASRRR